MLRLGMALVGAAFLSLAAGFFGAAAVDAGLDPIKVEWWKGWAVGVYAVVVGFTVARGL